MMSSTHDRAMVKGTCKKTGKMTPHPGAGLHGTEFQRGQSLGALVDWSHGPHSPIYAQGLAEEHKRVRLLLILTAMARYLHLEHRVMFIPAAENGCHER